MLPPEAYLAERSRSCARPAMYQNWRDLLFLHFSTEPAAIRSLIPAPLEIDTFPDESGEERAWIGLVPFRMCGVRPRFMPTFPGLSAFPETNVRTYVHLNGRPAVWFYSLDAASGLACQAGRRLFKLPYKEAAMTVDRDGDSIKYHSVRRSDGAGLDIEARLEGAPAATLPGTLEFFLVERYVLYCTNGSAWFAGDVHHSPYTVRRARTVSCAESLVPASGIARSPFCHVLFSEGVDVKIGSLKRVTI
jgi:uncharacterized protein